VRLIAAPSKNLRLFSCNVAAARRMMREPIDDRHCQRPAFVFRDHALVGGARGARCGGGRRRGGARNVVPDILAGALLLRPAPWLHAPRCRRRHPGLFSHACSRRNTCARCGPSGDRFARFCKWRSSAFSRRSGTARRRCNAAAEWCTCRSMR
jgi:hypothetical protein